MISEIKSYKFKKKGIILNLFIIGTILSVLICGLVFLYLETLEPNNKNIFLEPVFYAFLFIIFFILILRPAYILRKYYLRERNVEILINNNKQELHYINKNKTKFIIKFEDIDEIQENIISPRSGERSCLFPLCFIYYDFYLKDGYFKISSFLIENIREALPEVKVVDAFGDEIKRKKK